MPYEFIKSNRLKPIKNLKKFKMTMNNSKRVKRFLKL